MTKVETENFETVLRMVGCNFIKNGTSYKIDHPETVRSLAFNTDGYNLRYCLAVLAKSDMYNDILL